MHSQYLIVAKGELLVAVIINPLLYALRGPRNALTFMTSRILGKTSPDSRVDFDASKKGDYSQISAKERVLRKWGSEWQRSFIFYTSSIPPPSFFPHFLCGDCFVHHDFWILNKAKLFAPYYEFHYLVFPFYLSWSVLFIQDEQCLFPLF